MKWIGIYSHTHKPVLWRTADADIMRCFTVLRVVIALAWCVKIKATLLLHVIVILDHTCYLSAWADCNQTLTVHTLSLTVLGSIISFEFCYIQGYCCVLHLGVIAEAFERDMLSISSRAQTHTGTEGHASLADSQVLKGRNLSLICLSSSVLLQWPNQTERESVCTHIPTSKRNLAEIYQLSQKKTDFNSSSYISLF